jgi:hypothetical protein
MSFTAFVVKDPGVESGAFRLVLASLLAIVQLSSSVKKARSGRDGRTEFMRSEQRPEIYP